MSLQMEHAVAAERPREAPPAPPVLGLEAAAVSQVIERLGDPSLLSEGKVHVIALDGIAERMGARWEMRRDLVYDHVERVLQRHLGRESVYQRAGEAQYVVVQPEESRLTAQGLCLRSLREILLHFLGQADIDDIRVHEVTRISSNGIFGQRLDAATARPEPPAATEQQTLPPWAGAASQTGRLPSPLDEPRSFAPRAIDQWTPFVAADGRRVRVSCTLEPVLSMARSTRIGYRLARRVLQQDSERALTSQELQNLSRADIARIDFATIARGLDRLRSEADGVKQPTLIVPVSYITLFNQRTRAQLVALLREAKSEVRHGLVCEICDIEGAPPGGLLTAVSMIRPFCVRVLGFLADPCSGGLKALKGLGLHGLSVECPPAMGDAEFVGWLREVRTATRPVAQALFAYHVTSNRRAAMASASGFSHVSLTAGSARTHLLDS